MLWGAVLINAPCRFPPVAAVPEDGIVIVILSSKPVTTSPLIRVNVISKPVLPVLAELVPP